MNTNTRTPDAMNERQVLQHLTKLREAIDLAELELGDFIVELVDSAHWTQIAWADMAAAMNVSRQAVQQRVARLLADGSRRRAKRLGVNPDQLSLDDAVQAATDKVPTRKGRKG